MSAIPPLTGYSVPHTGQPSVPSTTCLSTVRVAASTSQLSSWSRAQRSMSVSSTNIVEPRPEGVQQVDRECLTVSCATGAVHPHSRFQGCSEHTTPHRQQPRVRAYSNEE